jgi:hypothetical protein
LIPLVVVDAKARTYAAYQGRQLRLKVESVERLLERAEVEQFRCNPFGFVGDAILPPEAA